MASAQYEAIKQLLIANPTRPNMNPKKQRATMEMMAEQSQLPRTAYTEELMADSVPALLVAAEGVDDSRVILLLHGGAYLTGSSRTHRELAHHLSELSGARVLVLDYRLAPEHPFPAAVDDVLVAYKWLVAQGIGNIAIAGDSAGGGLALASLVRLKEEGVDLSPVRCAVLLSPWTDMTLTADSLVTNAETDPALSVPRLKFAVKKYLRRANPEQPYASPLFADLGGLPPLSIHVGGGEILLDDSKRVAQKIAEKGGVGKLTIWPEMMHGWYSFFSVMPEAEATLQKVCEFLQEHMDG